jgi:hypothetical protein
MKLRAPDGCCGASHAGHLINISADGAVEVGDDACAVFFAHGFTPSHAEKIANAVAKATDMTAGISRRAGSKTARGTYEPCDMPALAGRCRDAATETPLLATQDDEISTLNRRELFAVLRTMGVPVSLPITNEGLRAAARRARDG